MDVIEETIDATLDANGQLRLTHQPRLPPGPVLVTIRVAAAVRPQRGSADVIREIAAEQRSRGFPAGRLKTCALKTTLARPRTLCETGNWTPPAACPRRGGHECCTTWTP